MMEAPRYLAGDSFLDRRDPRVLILVPALTVVTVAQIQDLRLMVAAVVVAVGYYASARIPFDAVRANWAFVGVFVGLLAGVNGLIVGAQQHGDTAEHLFSFPVIGIAVSTASLSYMITMLLRFLAIAATGFSLAFAVRPVYLAVPGDRGDGCSVGIRCPTGRPRGGVRAPWRARLVRLRDPSDIQVLADDF